MATGYLVSNGTDLDNVFDPYVTGTSPSQTGYKLSDGADINTRYAPLSFGSAAATTGYKIVSGADLNTLFAAKGTASYWPNPLPWQQTFIANPVTIGNTSRGILEFRTNGTLWFKESSVAFGSNQGTFLQSGLIASEVEVRAQQLSGLVALQNDLVDFVPINQLREIIYSTSTSGQYDGVFLITVRRIADTSDSASGNCTMRVTVGV